MCLPEIVIKLDGVMSNFIKKGNPNSNLNLKIFLFIEKRSYCLNFCIDFLNQSEFNILIKNDL